MLLEHIKSQPIFLLSLSFLIVLFVIYQIILLFKDKDSSFWTGFHFFFYILPLISIAASVIYFLLDISSYSIKEDSFKRVYVLSHDMNKNIYCYNVNNDNILSINLFSKKPVVITASDVKFVSNNDLVYVKDQNKTFHILNCFPNKNDPTKFISKTILSIFSIKSNDFTSTK